MVYPLWFLRDLLILNVLFIAIKKVIDRFPFGTLALLLIFWTSDIKIYLVSPEALLFFALGYYAVKYSADHTILDKIKLPNITVIYLSTIVLELYLTDRIEIIHKINIIIGSILLLKLTKYFVEHKKIYNKLLYLDNYSFFVYAVHGLPLAAMTKLSVKVIPMHDAWLLLQYFAVNLGGIALFLAIGIWTRKLFPKAYAVLTGGRA
jgi:uncharacterized membrane protein